MKTILICEDDIELRRMFRTALVVEGYWVLEASDGLQALRLIESAKVDLVLLDLGLPIVDGYVVLQDTSLAHASCVLSKPVAHDKLVSTIRQCMAQGSSAQGA